MTVMTAGTKNESGAKETAYLAGFGHPSGVAEAFPTGQALFELTNDGLSVSVSVACHGGGPGFLRLSPVVVIIVVEISVWRHAANVDVHLGCRRGWF